MGRILIPSLLAAAAATPVAAQSITYDTHVTYSLAWSEHNGNANGILEPGESALITMDVSVANQFGLAMFSPPIGAWTSGTIMGFGFGFLDLHGSGGSAGTFNYSSPLANAAGTSGYGLRGGWRVGGNISNGTPNAAGDGMINIQPGYLNHPPGVYNTLNPITNMYRLLWTPNSYADRTVSFALARAAATNPSITGTSVYLDLDGSVGTAIYVANSNISHGSVSIAIVPAPPIAACFVMTGLFTIGRRRRARLALKGDPP
jgi:hypothetical protein